MRTVDGAEKIVVLSRGKVAEQGTPSYLLLLYLMREQTALQLEDKTIAETIKLLTTFFVRRKLTDIPNTQDALERNCQFGQSSLR